MHQSLNLHFHHLKHVLHYVQTTTNHRLLIIPKDFQITTYCDSDWVGDTTIRRSTTGYHVFLSTVPISWAAKKQTSVAQSSIEPKYRALASTFTELTWIHQLLSKLPSLVSSSTSLYCDNSAAISLAHNPILHAKTKHIDIDCHFIRDYIKINHINLHHIPSTNQVADILTKPLYNAHFQALSGKLATPSVHQFEGEPQHTHYSANFHDYSITNLNLSSWITE